MKNKNKKKRNIFDKRMKLKIKELKKGKRTELEKKKPETYIEIQEIT